MEWNLIYKIFGLLFFSELAYFKVADRLNIIDKPNKRSSHERITLLGGGVVFYFGVLLYSIWFNVPYHWYFAGLTLLAGISFLDDIRPIPSKIRLVFHFAAMMLMFQEWGLFSGTPLWYILAGLIFCTGIINAYNFMDGINGLTGVYSFVIILVLEYINTQIVHFIDSAYLGTVLISLAVFIFFNFRKNAKCFAGDVGSVGIAFIILFALGKLILVTKDPSYLIVLAVYGVDTILTIVHRIMLKENILEAHRKHAYQLMANELKMPHVLVSSIYAAVQALIIAGYFIFTDFRWLYFACVIAVLSIAYVIFMRKYFKIHVKAIEAKQSHS